MPRERRRDRRNDHRPPGKLLWSTSRTCASRRRSRAPRRWMRSRPPGGSVSLPISSRGCVGNPGGREPVALDERANAFSVHGGRFDDNAPIQDGLVQRCKGAHSSSSHQLTFQEVVVETGAISAERNTGGVQMNIVHQGRRQHLSGSFSTSHTTPTWQSGNLTDELRARGLRSSPSLKRHYGHGRGDRRAHQAGQLWFFNAYRFGKNQAVPAGQLLQTSCRTSASGQIGLPCDVLRTGSRPAGDTPTTTIGTTACAWWQAAAKHKIVGSLPGETELQRCSGRCWRWAAAGRSRGARGRRRHTYKVNYLPLVSWTYPGDKPPPDRGGGVSETCSTTTPSVGSKPRRGHDRDHRALDELSLRLARVVVDARRGLPGPAQRQYRQRFSMSYIPGSHAFKPAPT